MAVNIDVTNGALGPMWPHFVVTSSILLLYYIAWLWSIGHSSEWDIYQAVTSLTELRELSRRFPGRSVYAKLVSRVYNWKETHSLSDVNTAFEQHKEYTLSKIRRKRDGRRRPAGNGEQPAARDVDAQQSGAEREDAAEEKKREGDVDLSAPHVRQHTHASHPHRPPTRSRAKPVSRTAPRQAIVREVLKEVLPALLQQQQALMGSALNAMGSSVAVDTGEDSALSFGCRNCDTLQRQVEELRAELKTFKAAALSAAASQSRHAALSDAEEDGETLQMQVEQLQAQVRESMDGATRQQPAPPTTDPASDEEKKQPSSRSTARDTLPFVVIQSDDGSSDPAAPPLETTAPSSSASESTELQQEAQEAEEGQFGCDYDEVDPSSLEPQPQPRAVSTTGISEHIANGSDLTVESSTSRRHSSSSQNSSSSPGDRPSRSREHHHKRRRSCSPAVLDPRRVWVGLDSMVQADDLRRMLWSCGSVRTIDGPFPSHHTRGRGYYAFAHFDWQVDAQYAVEESETGRWGTAIRVKAYRSRVTE